MIDLIENVKKAFQTGEAPDFSQENPLEKFLKPDPKFSAHWLDILQPEIGDVVPDEYIPSLYVLPEFENRRRLQFNRVGLEGKLGDVREIEVRADGADSTNSLSLTRQMGQKKDFVRGRSGRLPFTPGGLNISADGEKQPLRRDPDGLFTHAPGLSRGHVFEGDKAEGAGTVEGAGIVQVKEQDDDEDAGDEGQSETSEDIYTISTTLDDEQTIDHLLPEEISFARKLASSCAPSKAKVWAHVIDVTQKIENFEQMVPNPARTWPFELDTFQKEAVYHLEQGDSVFIAAHTSAGKTVVAEYAMSMAKQHMTKCIYTSPIKALSNQKYRDFSQEYDDVGILTGDVQLNPEASTLIMTTEILRSMLYRGADIIRDVEFVIFDEVHYVNDSDRGVVWEEVIIMLPDHVKFILLSATVPNTYEFASWVGRTKQKNIYVISTPKRPVPLRHHVWAKKKLFEIVDENGKFEEDNYRKCSNYIQGSTNKKGEDIKGAGGAGGKPGAGGKSGAGAGAAGGKGNKQQPKTGPMRQGPSSASKAMKVAMGPQRGRMNQGTPSATELRDLMSYLKGESLLPAVVFVFSRKMCEQHAMSLRSMDLNAAKEKSEVVMFFDQACSRLRQEDRALPQIAMLKEFASRGIGVHHSGLLPIMKEVVEILFARGLVKILFATETFAMGLNLPTRTVVFSAIRKFDSKSMRNLLPGEYTQMAGRAGRRGLDKTGTVIILNTGDQLMAKQQLQSVIQGTPTKLTSQFRLTYTMILSLLRIEAVKVEDIIGQSFSENATHMLRPDTEKQIKAIEQEVEELQNKSQKSIPETAYELDNGARIYSALTTNIYQTLVAARNPIGHLIIYRVNGQRAAGVIMGRRDPLFVEPITEVPRNKAQKGTDELPFLPFVKGYADQISMPSRMVSRYSKIEVPISDVELISKHRVDKKLTSFKTMKVSERLRGIQQCYRETLLKDPDSEVDLGFIKAMNAQNNIKDRKKCISELQSLDLGICQQPNFPQLFSEAHAINEKQLQVGILRNSVAVMNTELIPDYEQRVGVLKDANYLDEHLNVLLKGRVACEISTGFELYLTELLLDNFLGTYEPEEIVALLSAFIFEGARGVEEPKTVTPKLDSGKERLLEIVEYVHELAEQRQVSLTQDESEFSEKGRFALMEVVYEWARGMSFYEITKLTSVHEGLIVRVISRLDEVCRAVMNAARIMGDAQLYDKVSIAQEKIKRDIVFCSSLYL